MIRLISFTVIVLFSILSLTAQDWANLNRFQEENEKLMTDAKIGKRVVFMGNSITEGWLQDGLDFFEINKHFVNRGISGQTTPQMLIRFKQDVVNIDADVVVILAGINDIAHNTGPSTVEMIFDNITSMIEIAKSNGISVVVSSVLPANVFPWRDEIKPAEDVIRLNKLLRAYAKECGLVYLDYYTFMVDDKKGLQEELGTDGVHPNIVGYQMMEGLATQAINKALRE